VSLGSEINNELSENRKFCGRLERTIKVHLIVVGFIQNLTLESLQVSWNLSFF
jgi:hypothetical protein